jgi:signal peptidase II
MDRSRTRIYIAALLAGAVVVVDQAAKALAARAEPTAHNRALAFGIATGPAAVLAAFSILMLGVFVVLIGRWTVQVGISPAFPALIAGGGIGNAIDRVRLGAVRDFIGTPWVVVNVADLAVVVGVLALVVALMLRVRSLRIASCRIALEIPKLRATIVRDDDA